MAPKEIILGSVAAILAYLVVNVFSVPSVVVPLQTGDSINVKTDQLGNRNISLLTKGDGSVQDSTFMRVVILPLNSQGANAKRAPLPEVDKGMFGEVQGEFKQQNFSTGKVGRRVEVNFVDFQKNHTKETREMNIVVAIKLFLGTVSTEDEKMIQSKGKIDGSSIPEGFTEIFRGPYPAGENSKVSVQRIIVADLCSPISAPAFLQVLVVPASSQNSADLPVGFYACPIHLNYTPSQLEAQSFWTGLGMCDTPMLSNQLSYRLWYRTRQYLALSETISQCQQDQSA